MVLNISRRLLVSQDRHEIYLTVASYDQAYIDYVTGKDKTPGKSILHMLQVGPYTLNHAGQMQRLSRILLAFCYQEYSTRSSHS